MFLWFQIDFIPSKNFIPLVSILYVTHFFALVISFKLLCTILFTTALVVCSIPQCYNVAYLLLWLFATDALCSTSIYNHKKQAISHLIRHGFTSLRYSSLQNANVCVTYCAIELGSHSCLVFAFNIKYCWK